MDSLSRRRMVSRGKQLKRLELFILLILVLTIPVSNAQYMISPSERVTKATVDAANSDDWSRSNITLPAAKNWTFSFSNSSVIELPSQMSSPLMEISSPTMLKIDVVRGFEPEQRLNSQFEPALYRRNTDYSTLIETNNGVSFKFNGTTYPSYAVYNLSFTNPLSVSRTDVLSLAFSTSSSFNSSQALIGASLILRDDNNNRYYVSVVISDQHSGESFGLSPWFLGEGFSAELPQYPYYSLKYESLNGPWFRQLSLSEALTALNLPTAWIDGLLVGGEIGYVGPPLWVKNGAPAYSMTEVDAMFYFTLIQPQPFLINQQPVNSTSMAFPYQQSLSFSGISGKSVTITIDGFLRPSSESQESLDNETISHREIFFDLATARANGVAVNGGVNITVSSSSVEKCLVVLNNETVIDLTDTFLSSNTRIYVLPENTSTVKVLLTLYKFNAWLFTFSYLTVVGMTKSGIVEESFSAENNEGIIDINATAQENTNLAIRTGGLVPEAILLDGIEQPLRSMLMIGGETYIVISLVESLRSFSLYTVQYLLSDRPLYESFTATPFELHFNGSILRIFTPFNVEGQVGFNIPLTVQMVTYRTFVLRIEYDSSSLETGQKEIMAYSARTHYEYFMLRPMRAGQSIINLKIVDAADEKTFFSSLFFVQVVDSSLSQIVVYLSLSVSVFSVITIFLGRYLVRRIRRVNLK